MKKLLALITLFATFAAVAQEGSPSTYYNGFNWTLTGTALRNALATKITSTHTNQLSYDDVWDADKIVDKDPANSNNVLLVYGWENGSDGDVTNDLSRSKNSNGGGSGDWNREHTYAKSLGSPDLGTSGPGADAHHLRASDVQRNNARGSKKFAAGSGNSGSTGANWYPGDQWKGDIARMMMYMYLRYGDQCLPVNVGVGTTVAGDPNMIQLFLQWNADDPVSAVEDQRNTYLGNANNSYGQGNRNPFIDNPYLAYRIWGGPTVTNRWPGMFLSTEDFDFESTVTVWPNPASNHEINIDTTVQPETIDIVTINGQLFQHIEKPVFQGTSMTVRNLPSGFYFVRLTAGSDVAVKKVVVR